MHNQVKIGLLAVAFLIGGCATVQVPTGSMQNSLSTIKAAEELGAENVPQAKLHLTLAQEQNQKAKDLLVKDEEERAGYVLMRSEADGELALALTHENSARLEAQKAAAKLDAPKN